MHHNRIWEKALEKGRKEAALSPSTGEPASVAGEAAEDMLRTAKELRDNSNGDPSAIQQAIMWEGKAAALSKPTPVEAGALRETCEHLEFQLDLGHATIFLTPGKARTILAALSQPGSSESGGWLPIETAPKDGTVIGWVPCAKRGDRIELVKLRNGKPFTVGSEFAFDRPPVTHWMPLPSIPSSKEIV